MSVPRFWRIYLALWLMSRWRLPATPCLILPVAVSLKRFFTPLLVFNLGIFVSLCVPKHTTLSDRHGMPFGRAIGFSTKLESAALYWRHSRLARRRVAMERNEQQGPDSGVTPHLMIADRRAADAIEFYTQAFGARELHRVPAPD